MSEMMDALGGKARMAKDGIGAAARDEALAELLGVLREGRAEFGAQRQMSDEVVRLMRAAGVYRTLVAKRFGGDEASPADFLRLIERIATADGSAGWVASFGVSSMYLASLPLATLEQIYADGPDVVFAGALFPPQKAVAVEGGLEVSGRWQFGSGATGASLIGVGVKSEEGPSAGLPRMAVMPAEKVTILPNWEVIGLQGTGSHDLLVDKVVVPHEWTFVRGSPATLDLPLYRYPSMALAAQVLAVVAIGVARAALDEIVAMAGGRASITGAPLLADRAYVQIELAKAEAALRSARAFFYEATEEAFAIVSGGDPLPVEKANMLRLASSHVARVGADVARTAYTLSGTTGIYSAHPLARHVQDAMVVVQHAFLSEGTWQNAGRVLLGLDTPPGFP
ncbi:acyl-CoA dehydrogenase [Sphingomonas oleivorans]|uniref:Acyl-CoA dehydrogenase n=1 Tax=Sphingomonas oleivorans TaxID=1735121 RepID=A0A2T5G376_9SPHN|nr:acyl-CoA dehydrogenase family protein [Sphingomonas oleivorans]PTQ13586.1 acyl-CoA dehydrogenase [Sphingomonas oleivorans]